MDEHELNNSQEGVVTQDHEVSYEPENQEPSPVNQEDVQEKNWREMRQRQKELEQRLRQKEEMLEKFMSAQLDSQARQTPAQVVEADDPDDEYIPAGKVKGIARKTVQPLEDKIKALENQLAQQQQEKYMSSLRHKYSDFDDIVNVDTLELLEQKEPELAATIAEIRDPYKMAIQSYKYIKALNLSDEVPNARRSKEVKKKLEQNAKTVQSPLAYDKRPMAQAFKASEADRQRLYEEMMGYASQATGF